MGFLAKFPQVSYPTAALIIFLGMYLGAALTTLVMLDLTWNVLPRTFLVFLVVTNFMTLTYVVSRLRARMDIVDAAWGLAFIVAAGASFMLNPHGLEVGANLQTVTTGLVTVWGLRLTYHIVRRLVRHPEDKRYQDLRKKWRGNVALNTFFRVYLAQAVLAVVVSIAVIHINFSQPQSIGWVAWVGIGLWAIGFIFEAVGDWQLKRFISLPKNRGKLMTQGLWKYTRHPNYFGEAVQWWGIAVIAFATPHGWVAVLSPVIITFLLRFVSGVPLAEQSSEKKSGWQAYKKRTSVFVPWVR